jgi:exodeoxyribonuclease-3
VDRLTRLVSWNVNGIRSCVRKGFLHWLSRARADVVALQETRCELEDLPESLRRVRRYRHASWSTASAKRGYSGVGLLSRVEPLRVSTSLGVADYDREGRFVLAEFESLLVASVYFPKGSGNLRDNSRVPYKLAFTRHLFSFLDRERRRRGKPAVILGDVNIAPHPIDLARPRGNETTSGFLPEERDLLARCLSRGWSDAYRALHPERVQYTWWSNRFGVREKNIGWRIDHAIVSDDLLPRVRQAYILDQVRGSDHCPIGIDLAIALDAPGEARLPAPTRVA